MTQENIKPFSSLKCLIQGANKFGDMIFVFAVINALKEKCSFMFRFEELRHDI